MSSHAKSKAYAHPIATQAGKRSCSTYFPLRELTCLARTDDLKYKTKYKELKAKIGEVEEVRSWPDPSRWNGLC